MAAKVAAKKAKTKTYESSIEAELLDITAEKAPGRKEERGAFLTRLANAVDGLENDEYKMLSEEAQEWFEQAARAVSKDKVPADFADADGDDNGEGEGEGEETVTKTKRPQVKAKGNSKKEKTVRTRRDPDAKYKVNPNYTAREGTMMETLYNQAKSMRSFTRDQLVDATKKKLTEERARRFIAWSLAHDVFVQT